MKRRNEAGDEAGEDNAADQKVSKISYDKICVRCTFANNYLMEYCELCEAELPRPVCDFHSVTITELSSISSRLTSAIDENTINPKAVLFPIVSQKDTSVTNGLIELIELRVMHQKGIRKYRLCSPTSHLSQVQSVEGIHWSCGYRNIQILCTSLIQVPKFRQLLFNKDGDIPSIYGIQAWIEKAWKDGFDIVGAADLAGPSMRLVGTTHWIGAAECATLLRFFSIDAAVVDFHQNYFVENKSVDSSVQLFQWVKKYFEVHKQQRSVHIPPLYFQHDGHSRSIIGYEQKDDSQSLLLFDPFSCGSKLKINLQENRYWQTSIKRGIHTLQNKSYQIVYIPPNAEILTREGREVKKIVVGEQPAVIMNTDTGI